MSESPNPTQSSDEDPNLLSEYELPPGNHALEIAARRGIGPLSLLGRDAWHGEARPCVSCGQLVRRDAFECDQCGQDLGEQMLEKMRSHCGSWYVHEHVRPFPGVTLERIVRQIRRGVITETSIIRGPETNHQWRFAVETPGICRLFNSCWQCQEEIETTDAHCPDCGVPLGFGVRPNVLADAPPTTVQTTPALEPTADSDANTEPRDADGRVVESQVSAPVSATPSDASESAPPTDTNEPRDSIPQAVPTPQAVQPQTEELRNLSAALKQTRVSVYDPSMEAAPRIAGVRATWIVIVLLAIMVIVLVFITGQRS